MNRGSMQISSRIALVAAAGMLMSAYACVPAQAADLGGTCCDDLEDRVAELEATTARKGNRVVSLQVFGQVNKALMVWDDGIDSDVFIVDNDYSGSRVGFKGTAKVIPGLKVGYLLEFDFQDDASNLVNNGDPTTGLGARNGDDVNNFFTPAVNNGEIKIRYNNWYIEHPRVGRITLGQGSTAADGAYEVVLGNSLRNSNIHHGNSFALRYVDPLGRDRYSGGRLSDSPQAGGSWAGNLETDRDELIRYDTPSFYGFILSASWGDNDYADVAVRFRREMNSIRVAAAFAYEWDSTRDASLASLNPNTGVVTVYNPLSNNNDKSETIGGSASVMHVPTGLYLAAAAASREYDNSSFWHPNPHFWYVQGGIDKRFLPFGSSTLYAEYGVYEDFRFDGSDATRIGLGAVQRIDTAAMDVYAQATLWSFDHEFIDGLGLMEMEDVTTVLVGSRVKF